MFRVHVQRLYLTIFHMLSEERSLYQGMLVSAELTIVGAQLYRRQVVLIHSRRRRHLVPEERQQFSRPYDVRRAAAHHIILRLCRRQRSSLQHSALGKDITRSKSQKHTAMAFPIFMQSMAAIHIRPE